MAGLWSAVTAVVVAATPDNGVVTRPVTSATVTPVVPGTPASAAVSPASPASATAPVTARAASAPSTTPVAVASAPGSSDENLAWIWPTTGAVTRNFEEPSNNGIDVGGKLGTPVVAAMDGRVVYVGSAIRGLGNLVVIKHNATYMSAYAHNQTIVVREDQLVSKGQKIAEMGSSDTDKVKLHFEIRRMGKPMDPLKYLPAR